MDSPTEVGTRYGDVTVRNVLCNNITVHHDGAGDDYTATFKFDNNCGLVGLLFNEIKSKYRDTPTFMVRASMDLTSVSANMPCIHTVYIRRHHSMRSDKDGKLDNMVRFSPGMYTVSDVAQYKLILLAIVDVKFRNVYIADAQCFHTTTNAVLHGGIEVEHFGAMELSGSR